MTGLDRRTTLPAGQRRLRSGKIEFPLLLVCAVATQTARRQQRSHLRFEHLVGREIIRLNGNRELPQLHAEQDEYDCVEEFEVGRNSHDLGIIPNADLPDTVTVLKFSLWMR